MTTDEKDKILGQLMTFGNEADDIEIISALMALGIGIQTKSTPMYKIKLTSIDAFGAYAILKQINK